MYLCARGFSKTELIYSRIHIGDVRFIAIMREATMFTPMKTELIWILTLALFPAVSSELGKVAM